MPTMWEAIRCKAEERERELTDLYSDPEAHGFTPVWTFTDGVTYIPEPS